MRKLIFGIAAIVCIDALFIARTYLATDVALTVNAISTITERRQELYWMNDLITDSFIQPPPEYRVSRSVGVAIALRSTSKVETAKSPAPKSRTVLFPTRVIYIPPRDPHLPRERSRIRIVKSGNTTLILYPGAQVDRPKKTNFVALLIPQFKDR